MRYERNLKLVAGCEKVQRLAAACAPARIGMQRLHPNPRTVDLGGAGL